MKNEINNKFKGTASIVLAVACYGMFGALAKFVGNSFGPFTQNWFRNSLVMIFIILFAAITHQKWKIIDKKDYKWMAAWTLSGSINTVLLFISFNNIPIGTAYFLLYASMIGTGFIGGKLVFQEKISFQKILCLGLAFLGLIIIYFLDIKSANPIYIIFALSAGIMVGLWNVFSKKVSDNYPNSQLVFIDAFMSALVGIVGSIALTERLPVFSFTTPWKAIGVWAVAQLAATGLVIYGFKKLEAQIASVILPLEVLFGTLFGFLFFHQVLPITTLIGGIMIASAAAFASVEIK